MLDHSTFWANLTELNNAAENTANPLSRLSINSSLEYSALPDLKLPDMSPRSWWNYVKKLAKSRETITEAVSYTHLRAHET